MRKVIVAFLMATLGLVGLAVVAPSASAAVLGEYGHNERYYDINGNPLTSSAGARIRVAVTVRVLSSGSGTLPAGLDINVCVSRYATALPGPDTVRASIDGKWLRRQSDGRQWVDGTQLVSSATYFCADLDPNVPGYRCGCTVPWQAFAIVSFRRDDGVLISDMDGNSDQVSLGVQYG